MGTAKDLIERGSAAYADGDVATMTGLYADDAVLVAPDGRYEGIDAIRGYWEMSMGALKGDVAVTSGIEQGDTYAGEFQLSLTNVGPLAMPDGTELPATGKEIQMAGAEFAVVRNGKLVEHRMYWDNMAAFQQLGLV
jgi:ketosteroid isomerase-like protein